MLVLLGLGGYFLYTKMKASSPAAAAQAQAQAAATAAALDQATISQDATYLPTVSA